MAKCKKCFYCKENIESEQPIKVYQNKNYHMSCFRKMQDELYKKHKTQEETINEINNLVCKIFKIDEITPLLKRQIEKIFEENPKFTLTGLYNAIDYHYRLQGNIPNKYGLKIVQYCYLEANEFFNNIAKLKSEKIKIESRTMNVKVQNSKQKDIELIDISKI